MDRARVPYVFASLSALIVAVLVAFGGVEWFSNLLGKQDPTEYWLGLQDALNGVPRDEGVLLRSIHLFRKLPASQRMEILSRLSCLDGESELCRVMRVAHFGQANLGAQT